MIQNKLTPILLGIAIFLVFITLLISFFLFSGSLQDERATNPTPSLSFSPSPTIYESTIKPPSVSSLPRDPRYRGAILTTDPRVQTSEEEIQKITSSLPYLKDYTLPTGTKISIVIPGTEYQDAPWKLTAQIFGIDYQIPENDPTYRFMQNAFLEGATDIFSWIESQGADPEKIIFTWGDKAYIQERAEDWLK